MENMQLTDDEVVALALKQAQPWPYPLPTLEPEPSVLAAAGRRGVRSLIVRGLAGVVDDGLEFNDGLVAQVSAIASSRSWRVAYVAPADAPETVAGDATYVVAIGGGRLAVDRVSPSGLHSISESSAEEGLDLLLALAKNVFDYGIKNGEQAALMIGASDGDQWVAVRQSELAAGSLASGAFETTQTVDTWSPELFDTVLDHA